MAFLGLCKFAIFAIAVVFATRAGFAASVRTDEASHFEEREIKAVAQTYYVTTSRQLTDAVQSLSGPAIIYLAPGRYGDLILRRFNVGSLEIRSVDLDNPAIFSSLTIRDSSNISVFDLAFTRYRVDPRASGYLLSVLNTQGFSGTGLQFYGYGNSIDNTVGSAVMLRDSKDVMFQKSKFQFFRHGLSILNVANTEIRFNEFSDIQTDAIRGGGVDGLIVANNVATNFFPAEGDHPDGIQLWSAQQTSPGRNIIIRENLIVKGKGGHVQGIFVRDNLGALPFENIEITDNLVIGTMHNGIALLGASGGRIAGNEVWSDPRQRSWIRLNMAQNITVEGNRAERFLIVDNRGVIEQRANKASSRSYRNIGQGVREWVEGRPSFNEFRGPLLRSLMAD